MWLLDALDTCLSYTVTTVRKSAGAYLALVVLDKLSSYRGGRLNRFDCGKVVSEYPFMLKHSPDIDPKNVQYSC